MKLPDGTILHANDILILFGVQVKVQFSAQGMITLVAVSGDGTSS